MNSKKFSFLFFYKNGNLRVRFKLGRLYFFFDYDVELDCGIRAGKIGPIEFEFTSSQTRYLKLGPLIFSMVTVTTKNP